MANDPIFCSFCGKNRMEVSHLVGEEGRTMICSECWEQATEALATAVGCEPTMAYAVIKKARLDQAELYLRRQMALCRTDEIVGIRGPTGLSAAEDGLGATPGDRMPGGGTER